MLWHTQDKYIKVKKIKERKPHAQETAGVRHPAMSTKGRWDFNESGLEIDLNSVSKYL